MISKVEKHVLRLCEENEFFWKNHIEATVRNAKFLADKLGADASVVEAAAWLHDIAKLNGQRDNHHVIGADRAAVVLRDCGFPDDKIARIRRCIITHSSDINYPPESVEEKIVASADALAHFDCFLDMVFVAYKYEGPDGAREWLRAKYKKTYAKMMPLAQKIAMKKYEAILRVLEHRFSNNNNTK